MIDLSRLNPRETSLTMKYYFKYIGLAIGIQGLVWILLFGLAVALTPSPPMDRILEGFVRLYYPLVMLVERYGNFKGDANIIRPIQTGGTFGYCHLWHRLEGCHRLFQKQHTLRISLLVCMRLP